FGRLPLARHLNRCWEAGEQRDTAGRVRSSARVPRRSYLPTLKAMNGSVLSLRQAQLALLPKQQPTPKRRAHGDHHGSPLHHFGRQQAVFERDRRCTRQIQSSRSLEGSDKGPTITITLSKHPARWELSNSPPAL